MYHVRAQGVDDRMINVHQVIIIIIVSTCARTTDRRFVCYWILTRLCWIVPCVSSYRRVHLICSSLTSCSILMLYKDISKQHPSSPRKNERLKVTE